MRGNRTLIVALCALITFVIPLNARAAQAGEKTTASTPAVREVKTEMGGNTLRYPQLDGLADETIQQRINDAIVERAKIAQRIITLTTLTDGSVGLNVSYEAFLLGDVFSTVVSAVGIMENGRRGQEYAALSYRLSTGEPLTLGDLLSDPDAAAQELEAIMESPYMEEVSSYLENAEVAPLPVYDFSLDADGITFYYSLEQFSFVSGYCGAAQFTYDELDTRRLLRTEPDSLITQLGVLAQPMSDSQRKAAIADIVALGALPHVRAKLGDSVSALIDRYRLLRVPDQYPGGRYCQFEAPMFRQVLVMTDALTSGYENSTVNGLRSFRCNLYGLQTGVTERDRWWEVLGEPQSTAQFDETMAATYGLWPGTADYYDYPGAQLMLYADETGVLYAIRLTKN